MSGPFNFDRVLMSSATTGPGTLTLGSAITGFQAVPAVADGQLLQVSVWEVDGSGVPNGAWETFVGQYTHSGTTLTRGTLKASSTGSAVSFGATKRVSVSPLASSFLSLTTGTGENTTMVAGRRYIVDSSAWGANYTYTLPTTAAIGDEIEVDLLVGDDTHVLLLSTGAGQTCMLQATAVAASTEITRLFIGGEKMRFLYAAANKWLVTVDGRIAQKTLMRLSTTTTTNETAATWTTPTSVGGAWTADIDNATLASTANSRFKVRRAGNYALAAHAYPDTNLTDGTDIGVVLWKNGTATLIGTAKAFAPASVNPGALLVLPPLQLAVDDTVNYQFNTSPGSKKLRGGTGYTSWFSGLEVF